MANQINKWTLIRFKARTWLTLTGLCTIGFLIGGASGGFGAMIVVYFIYLYIQKRDNELAQLRWQYYVGEEGRVRVLCEDTASQGAALLMKYNLKRMYDPSMIGDTPKLCRTCHQIYSSEVFEYTEKCVNLVDVFPHSPKDDPPNGNPFRWYWFAKNGYPMPPDGWSEKEPWMPLSALDKGGAEAMAREGRQYYTNHKNPFWEAGFGTPPRWYTPKL